MYFFLKELINMASTCKIVPRTESSELCLWKQKVWFGINKKVNAIFFLIFVLGDALVFKW